MGLPRSRLTLGRRLLLVSAALLLLLAICACPTDAKGGRGGGRRGRGGGGGNGLFFLYDYLPWYLEIPIYLVLLCLIAVSPFACVIACAYCCGCLEDDDKALAKEGLVRCPLCDEKVDMSVWEDGTHPQACQESKLSLLSSFPILNLPCGRCRQKMLLWPKDKSRWFKCQDDHCEKMGKSMFNDGRNQVRCFMCDTVLCLACANRRNRRQEGEPAGLPNWVPSPARSGPPVCHYMNDSEPASLGRQYLAVGETQAGPGQSMPYPPPAGGASSNRDGVTELGGVNLNFPPPKYEEISGGREHDTVV